MIFDIEVTERPAPFEVEVSHLLESPQVVVSAADSDMEIEVTAPGSVFDVNFYSEFSADVLSGQVFIKGEKGEKGDKGEAYIGTPGLTYSFSSRLALAALASDTSSWQTYTFDAPLLVWEITHNRGVRRFNLVVKNAAGELQIVSPEVIDSNRFRLTFAEPMAGSVDVDFEVAASSGVV